MGVYLDHNGPNKQLHRLKAINYGGVNPHKVALFLPGPTQRCVREALNNGTVSPTTFIIAADNEFVTGTNKLIKKFLAENFANHYLFKGKIETLDITKLRSTYGLPGIGYSFLDFCGPLTGSRGKWVTEQLVPNTMPGSKLAFTFTTSPRSRVGKSLFGLALARHGNAWERIFEKYTDYVPSFQTLDWSSREINSLDTTTALATAICPEVSLETPSVYIDSASPMVLCLGTVNTNKIQPTAERKLLYHQPSNQYVFKESLMQTATDLVKSYKKATSSKKTLATWKRLFTIYCARRASETGRQPSRFRAGVKMALTKAGFNSSNL